MAKFKMTLLLSASCLLIIGFQNCSSGVNFSEDTSGSSLSKSDSLEVEIPSDQPQQGENSMQAVSCGNIDFVDVILNVKSIAYDHMAALADGPGIVSMSELESGFEFTPVVDLQTTQLRFILNDTGNVLVDANDKEYSLKTPSAQTAGLKVQMGEKVELKANQKYRMKVSFDPATQIVSAGKKCLLKPVLRVLDIEMI